MTRIENVVVGNLFDYARLIIVGIFAYFALVIILRVSGKRTLAAMNAFDFIVTSRTVSLLEGIFALLILVGLQYVVTWFSVRVNLVERMVKSEPRLLYHGGTLLKGAMKAERITEAEIEQALRAHGTGSLESVHAIVLETNGNLSVISESGDETVTALSDVEGPRP